MAAPTALITGCSRGLGRELALQFACSGFNLALICRSDLTSLKETARQCLKSNVETLYRKCDVRDSKAVENFVRDAAEKFDTLDVLINNAGVAHSELLNRITDEQFDRLIGTNLTGQMNCIRAAAKKMMKQRSGHIVNIGSLSATEGVRGAAAYSASKCALIGLTQSAAAELGRFNIKVNMVMPGYLLTDMTAEMTTGRLEAITRQNLLGRPSDFDEVCRFILHLVQMQNVSGQTFNLDSRIRPWS